MLYQDNGRDGKTHSYFYLAGSLVDELTHDTATGANANRYQHTDALGTPVVITNGSRAELERREYEPYGYQLTPALQDGVNYTGHVADAATGLVYMQQRYYDPMIGRFLSVDPVTADTVTGANFNRYWYANNNPYKFTDPDGRSVWTKLIKLVLKGGNVAAATAGLASDAKTVMNPKATVGERVLAGASIASEALPVSVGDVKDVAKGIKIASESKEANQIRHIFGQAKHKMDAVIEKFGNPEKARDAIDSSAQKALSEGKLNLNEDGVNSVTRVNIDGIDVDLVGGKVVDGKFELGSASRRDIEK